MLQGFLSVVRQRPTHVIRPKSFRHNAEYTNKNKKRTKHLYPCVKSLKYSGRSTMKVLSVHRNVGLHSRGNLCRGIHTTNVLRRQRDDNVPPVYYIQNPFAWLRNKMQVGRLQNTWDPEFTEEEFVRGAKQAISSITQALAREDFVTVQNLTNPHAAAVLGVTSRLWKDEVRRHISLQPEDVRLAVPTKIFFNRLYSNTDRICEIDAWFVGVKAIASETYFVVEILARTVITDERARGGVAVLAHNSVNGVPVNLVTPLQAVTIQVAILPRLFKRGISRMERFYLSGETVPH